MVKKKKTRRYYPRKKKRRGVRDRRMPILTVIPVAIKAGAEPIGEFMAFSKDGDYLQGAKAGADVLCSNFLGYNPKLVFNGEGAGFELHKAFQTYGLIILGYLGSRVASAVGVNRALKKVPFLGKYVKM